MPLEVPPASQANDFQLTEPAVLALLARLQDPSQLNVEIAQIANGVVRQDEAASLVPVPAAQVLDFIPPPSYLTDFPTIGIGEASTVFEDDTGVTTTGKHTLGVAVFCSDPDQHILAWELRRYVQAIARVCFRDRTLGTSSPLAAWGTGPVKIDWGPTLGSKAQPQTWMSWAVVNLWTRRDELP